DGSVDVKAASWSYQTALRSAIAGGVFSAIVLVLLVVNYLQIKVLDPVRAERLEMMKVKFIGESASAELLSEIRQLDFDIRRDWIRRRFFSRRGGYLLLGGLAVFVIGLKWTSTLRKKLPMPGAVEDKQAQQVREAAMARWAVTVGLGLFGVSALFVALTPQIDLVEDVAPSYPSEEEVNKNWAGFRGPGGSGVSAYTNIPVKWDGKTGEGIIWKAKVPLRGHNSPVVWEGRVFVSGAKKSKRQVYCFDALTGELLWTGDVTTAVTSSS
ncbi:unnamed protein product, partial [marine sediment metagenome]